MNRSLPRGFTLLELMVALALSTIVLLATLAIMIASQRSYQTEEEQGYIQQTARAALDFMSDDLRRAALGLPSQEEATEERFVAFAPTSVNNTNSPDRLVFQAGEGGVAYLQQPIPFSLGGSFSAMVIPKTLSLFKPGQPLAFFSIDREYLGHGNVTAVNDDGGVLSGSVLDLNGESQRTMEENFIIMHQAQYIIYAVGQGTQDHQLVRCITASPSDACPGSGGNDVTVADDVEDFQISVLLRNDPVWKTDFDFSVALDPAGPGDPTTPTLDRRNIKAIRLDILVRGWGKHNEFTDARTYTLGNRTFNPSSVDDDSRHHYRTHMLVIVRMPNTSYI
jgi:prepilin-type N-terminal cleavage/methylation domain-containing protein